MESIPGYDAWKTRGPDDSDHLEGCPLADDAEPVFVECGGEGQCCCFTDTFIGFLMRLWYGPCPVDQDPECRCDELIQDAKDEAAERRFEADRDDW